MEHSSVKHSLGLFDYEILALVGSGGAGPHDLLRMAQQSRVYAWAGESQYYVAPKRLARLGLLEARKEPGKTRERTVYTLTDAGRRALREWAELPSSFPAVRHEGLTRVLATDIVGEAPVLESLRALRDDLDQVEAIVAAAEVRAEGLPHRRKYLLLSPHLVRRLLDAHRDWLDEVEKELSDEER